ncbi:MAG: hypothetical protein IIU57_03745, partial [Oscillospiraceae bacterium]|nr:hypothetical protein [Oscillospiraceae bacterium]
MNYASTGLSFSSTFHLISIGYFPPHLQQGSSEEDLFAMPNMGQKSVNEIIQFIENIDSAVFSKHPEKARLST